MRLKLVIAAAFYSASVLAEASSFQITSLSNNVFIITEKSYGTNIGLIKMHEGVVLIDPMPGDKNLDKLHQIIRQQTKSPVRYILNTHQHFDHTGGNEYFVKLGGAVIESVARLPEVEVLLLKSHTAKDKVFFHRQSNSIFVGDIYDTSWHPTFYTGGISGFEQAVEKILALGDEYSTIIPSHGKPSGKAELRSFRNNTLVWFDRVKALKEQGMSVQQVMNEESIKNLLGKFNAENKADFVPEKAFRRFIERTFTVIDSEG
ncbi:MBL fold metallo-hydrolase [Pseudoalteromonas sp. T1lg65]|uniref:MBL fold metallo-hydrolase n=1 Tax=Pseudoalteromonas sp. T1lg65 TaxID=2077101 RepID=UPI003F7A9CC0